MSSTVAELDADIREMHILKERATRSNVASYIGEVLDAMEGKRQTKLNVNGTENVEQVQKWETIEEYTASLGGPTSRFVEVAVMLAGVGNLPKKNISCDFTPFSFDLKIRNHEGKNRRLIIRNLYGEIRPGVSAHYVKTDHITLNIAKTSLGGDIWPTLTSDKQRGHGDEARYFNDAGHLRDEGRAYEAIKRSVKEKISAHDGGDELR